MSSALEITSIDAHTRTQPTVAAATETFAAGLVDDGAGRVSSSTR